MSDRTLIILPAFNEADHLPGVLDRIRELYSNGEILIVDDGSTDRTSEIARSRGIPVVRHHLNLGYGAAIQTGAKYALASDYHYAVLLDADGQHDPSSIAGLLAPCQSGQADLVVGSRFREPGSYSPSIPRMLGIRVLAALTRTLTGLPITDPTSGFLALNRRAMDMFASPDFPTEYPDANNIIWLHRSGLRITERPALMHASPPRHSMHRGRKTPYYIFFMFFSILVITLRRK